MLTVMGKNTIPVVAEAAKPPAIAPSTTIPDGIIAPIMRGLTGALFIVSTLIPKTLSRLIIS